MFASNYDWKTVGPCDIDDKENCERFTIATQVGKSKNPLTFNLKLTTLRKIP